MSNRKYDAIWVNGSFFERGHWKYVPRGDSGGGAQKQTLAILAFQSYLINNNK